MKTMFSDDALEELALWVERLSVEEISGCLGDHDVEEVGRRKGVRQTREKIAEEIRKFKRHPTTNPANILAAIDAHDPPNGNYVTLLQDAWPLAWRGLCKIEVILTCNSNQINPEQRYIITITDRGREILDAHYAHLTDNERGTPGNNDAKEAGKTMDDKS